MADNTNNTDNKEAKGNNQSILPALKQLEAECPRLEQALKETRQALTDTQQALTVANAETSKWKAAYNNLKLRALKAYYSQQEEIKRLKEQLGERKE